MNTRFRRYVVLFALAAASGCSKSEPPQKAAPRPAASARAKLDRTALAGERLADVDRSKITVSMVKDKDFAAPVTATLGLRDGRLALDAAGGPSAKLSVDLMAFDSGIPLRNERVQKILFETSGVGWDTAELTIAKLPDDAVAALREKGKALHVTVDGELKMHGKTSKVSAAVDATTAPDGSISVRSSAPFEVKVSELGLTDNLKRLSSLCMHDSIEDAVKVELALVFPAK